MSPSYTFRAPPSNKYSVFQPGGYCKMYHHVEAEKMKRSHNWQLAGWKDEKETPKSPLFKRNQKKLPSIKSTIKDGILKLEIGDYEEPIIEVIPKITPKIEQGVLKVEIGENDQKKLVYIDLRGYLNIIE
ncbi:MAG: hypothetical protein ACFE8N_07890 [Promethearchaeota archaeon]